MARGHVGLFRRVDHNSHSRVPASFGLTLGQASPMYPRYDEAMLSRWLSWLHRSRPLGVRGEDAAVRYVRRTLRYRVIARNVRYTNGELDLVALDGKILVFVEVRTRSSETFGTPEQTIRHAKRQRVRRAARQFIKARRLYSLTPRIDVIAIVWPATGDPEIRYHQNAFPLKG